MGLFDFFSALGSLFSTIYTNEKNAYNAYLQRDWEESMMDKQNAYNDPSLQVERLQKAGINPIAGTMANGLTVSGNTSAGHNSVGLPSVQDPALALAQFMAGISGAQKSTEEALSEKTFRSARLDQIQKQSLQIEALTRNLRASTDAQTIANKYADAREQWALAGKKADVYLTYSEVAKTNAITRETIQNIKNLIASETETQTNIELNYLRMDEVLAHIDSMKAEKAFTEQKTLESVANTAESEQRTDLLSAETDKAVQESDRYGELTDKVIAEYDALIKKYMAETNKTEEEAYWILFDKADNLSYSVLGNKMPYPRMGRSRKRYEKMFEDKMLERGY